MDINELKEMSRNKEEENKMQETSVNIEEGHMKEVLDRSIEATKNERSSYSNLAFGNSAQKPKYDPLPEDSKDKALIFLNRGTDLLFRTLDFNQNTNWTEKEYNIMYGSQNSIMIKSMELKELVESLKAEKDISSIQRKLTETAIDWLDITPVGDGLFEMKNRKTGKVISIKNAEITISTIETLAQM